MAEDLEEHQEWQKLREKQFPPPISFTQCYAATCGHDNTDDTETNDTTTKVGISTHADPDDIDSAEMKKSVEVFEQGSTFKYCQLRENLEQLWVDLGIQGQSLK